MTTTQTATTDTTATPAPVTYLNRAMLASLTISQWLGQKIDAKATQELADQHQSDPRQAKVVKHLLPLDSKSFDRISKAVNFIRFKIFYAETLPWADGGTRLLTSKNFLNFATKMATAKMEFDSAVQALLDEYEALIEQAKAQLNGMFNAADYPTREELASKFAVKLQILPLPQSEALNQLADVSDEAIEALKAQIEEDVALSMAEAQKDLHRRLFEGLTALSRITEKGAHVGSLVKNLATVAESVPNLDPTGDPELAALALETQKALEGVDGDSLKHNAPARAAVRAEAERLAAQMQALYPQPAR